MPVITLAMLLEALLGAGLGIGLQELADAKPENLRKAVEKLRSQEQAIRRGRLQALVDQAIAEARSELAGRADPTGRDLLALLDHSTFAVDVAELLLLGGQPDVQRVRQHCQQALGPERSQELERPLVRFEQGLQRRLQADAVWGEALRQFQEEALFHDIDRHVLALDTRLAQIVAELQTQAAAIGQEVARQLHPLNLDELERHYLLGLYAECNEVPLAAGELATPDATQARRPRLQKIYVDLDTAQPPSLAQVWARLGVDAQKRPQAEAALREAWNAALGERGQPAQGRGAKQPDTEHLGVQHLRQIVQGGEDAVKGLAQRLGVAGERLSAAAQADLSALEALAASPQLVLLGDPGSGKSTLTRRLAGLLAAPACLDLAPEDRDWQTLLQPAPTRWLLPIRIELSQWAKNLAQATEGCADDLLEEAMRVVGHTARMPGSRQKERLTARLTGAAPTALLMLDGLDEVAEAGQRQRLLKAVRDFCRCYPQAPLIVTCRVRPYDEGQHYKLPLPAYRLAPLSRPAIGAFLQRWHAELSAVGIYQPDTAATAQGRLLAALDDPLRGELAEMAGTPLLLTMMARVNYRTGLPESRAALYEEYVRQLLWEWERQKQDDPGAATDLEKLLDEGRVLRGSLERALNQLAFDVHGQRGTRDTVDIPRHTLRAALERIHPGPEAEQAAWAVRVLRLMDERSGLINALKGDLAAGDQAEQQAAVYRFAHRTFQEYLAARWLASGERAVGKFRAKIDLEPWREVVVLALGYLVSVRPYDYDKALAMLLDRLLVEPQTEADWRRVLLLGEAYALLGPQRAGEAEAKELAKQVKEWAPARLTAAMQRSGLAARQRLAAGLLLDDLGVEPPGLEMAVGPPGDGPNYFIAAADWDFAIGRYPVSNAQYRQFVAAGGYGEKRWWTQEGWEDRQRYGWREPRFWADRRFNRDNQPVVGVSWREATAYCAWLTEALRAAGAITAQQTARLPTRAQWERAARSRHEKDYPWDSDAFDQSRANTSESGLGQTTPVHMYPAGRTPEGVWDLAGNVWEWTADVHADGWSWLKGGSWWSDKERAKASAADWYPPRNGHVYYGLRVVVVPVSRFR